MKRTIKPKLYIASSVLLPGVPDEHRASNGCSQFTILVRTTSVKRLCYILDTSYSHLVTFAGAHVTPEEERHANIVPKDEIDQIYYRVEHTATGWLNKWFKYERPDWLAKRNPL